MPPAPLRRATAADVPALAALYRHTALALGPWCYSAEQVAAWAHFAEQHDAFSRYVLDAETWVAVGEQGDAIGFSGATRSGEIHSLYVRHDLVRQGLGTQLLTHVLEQGRWQSVQRFAAWATPFSRPVFQRAGFRLAETVQGAFEGVMFERYRVVLDAPFSERVG